MLRPLRGAAKGNRSSRTSKKRRSRKAEGGGHGFRLLQSASKRCSAAKHRPGDLLTVRVGATQAHPPFGDVKYAGEPTDGGWVNPPGSRKLRVKRWAPMRREPGAF